MKNSTLPLTVALLAALVLRAEPLHIITDQPDGIYASGETVTWTVIRDLDVEEVAYSVKLGGLTEIEAGIVEFVHNQATIETSLDEPGTALLELSWTDENGEESRVHGGVVCEPEEIAMSLPVPEDFDAFWKARIAELGSIPMDTQLEKVGVAEPDIDYWKITMDNIRGSNIYGQIARPEGDGPLPALLIVQWAGVYPLQRDWVIDRAAEGWLVLNIIAHDIPIDEPGSYYENQRAGPLKGYSSMGKDDREESYFLRMFLSCYRAAEYLTMRPDWDGETLVVMGGSQGGYQALVTAGMHPAITAAIASVPAGCDLTRTDLGSAPGWPGYYRNLEGGERERVREAARYFDAANFASRIECPVLIGLGLIDTVCPPEGIFAAANTISAPVELVIQPQGGHGNRKGSHSAFNTRCYDEWLPALRRGEAVPVR